MICQRCHREFEPDIEGRTICRDCEFGVAEQRAYEMADKKARGNSKIRNQNVGLPFYELNWPSTFRR